MNRVRQGVAWVELLGVLVLGHLAQSPASAQTPGLQPSGERPELPQLEDDRGASWIELPQLTNPEAVELGSGPTIAVERLDFDGNTAFSDDVLARVAARCMGPAVSTADLQRCRESLTRHYVAAGYVTSGALLPDQRLRDGVVRFRIVEGRLAEVEVRGTKRFRKSWFETRLHQAGRAPLHVPTLENALQVMQQDRLVRQIRSLLEPGEAPGDSRLVVEVVEGPQQSLVLETANDRANSIGSYGGGPQGYVANLVGIHDELRVLSWFTEGLRDVDTRFDVPLNRFDTTFGVRFRYSEAKVVDGAFADLKIESESLTAGLQLRQPLLRTRRQQLWVSFTGEWRRSESTISLFPPSRDCIVFQENVLDCKPTVAVLRLGVEWTWRGREDVAAVRSLLSRGIDVLSATDSVGTDGPGGEYLAWLAQAQYSRRLPDALLGSQILTRADLQLASQPLLSLERMAIGGLRTVRGYAENQIVSDSGTILSAELRIPVWRTALGRPILQLATFWDFGHGWNESGRAPRDETLTSVGLGLIAQPVESAYGEIYWGKRLIAAEKSSDDLQANGIHFYVRVLFE